MDFFEKRPLFTILLSIIISFVVAFFLPNSVKLIVSAIALALFLFSFFLFRTFRKCAALMFLPFAIAMLNHFFFVHFAYLPMTDYQGKTIEVQGKTISEFTISDQSSYFVVRPDAILLEDKSSDVYGDVIVYCDRNTSEIEIGSHVSCLGNAFEDDSESLFHNYRITEKQFISMYSDEIKVLKPPSALNFRGWPVKLRDFFKNIYSDIFDDSSYALISGITLGERDLIDNATYADFKNSGVAHTLAVSGMHLAFLIAVLSFVLSAVCADLRVRAVLQLVLVWLFTALTGFSPSCCRAAVMLSIYLFGTLVHKEADSLTSLAVAVVLSCLYNPFAIFNPSLSLSAASTFGLLVLGGPIGSLMPSVKGHNLLARTIRFVTQTIAMSVAATVATLPIMVASFGSVSLLAPITNIVIIPVIEILFFIGLFAIIFAWCPPVTFVLSWLAKLLTDAACFVTSRIARLPFSTVATEGWQFWIALSILVLVIGVLIFWLR